MYIFSNVEQVKKDKIISMAYTLKKLQQNSLNNLRVLVLTHSTAYCEYHKRYIFLHQYLCKQYILATWKIIYMYMYWWKILIIICMWHVDKDSLW